MAAINLTSAFLGGLAEFRHSIGGNYALTLERITALIAIILTLMPSFGYDAKDRFFVASPLPK
ncbi:MAG: hypothetical protein K0M45_07855 [Candidatus Paracaedibacteraceae bacterium]|nr:hypothetical protein [Candidatus Paracaedibacteraceae bacterium]